jgi:Uma2 family endonuclease
MRPPTAIRTQVETPQELDGDEPVSRFVFDHVSWADYETALRIDGDRPIRVTYDRGLLEIISPSSPHEGYKNLFAYVVETLLEEHENRFVAAGSTTFRREDLNRGLEPDECYYITHSSKIRIFEEIDLRRDLPPDLAIELDISRSILDRLSVIASLGDPELWSFRDRRLRILRLRGAAYSAAKSSQFFPGVALIALEEWLFAGAGQDQGTWRKAFRAWVREQLAAPARVKRLRKRKN